MRGGGGGGGGEKAALITGVFSMEPNDQHGRKQFYGVKNHHFSIKNCFSNSMDMNITHLRNLRKVCPSM